MRCVECRRRINGSSTIINHKTKTVRFETFCAYTDCDHFGEDGLRFLPEPPIKCSRCHKEMYSNNAGTESYCMTRDCEGYGLRYGEGRDRE